MQDGAGGSFETGPGGRALQDGAGMPDGARVRFRTGPEKGVWSTPETGSVGSQA